jgi:hypothetical protein
MKIASVRSGELRGMNFKGPVFQDSTICEVVNTNGHRRLVDPQDVGSTVLRRR